jgi:import inner membrane translocase subunit TIM50
MYRELDNYRRLIKEPSRDKLLPVPLQYPHLQPKYTLVLELTDVLVHPNWTYNTGWRFKKRSGLEYFLDSLQGHFEIVIYTAEQGMTMFPLIEAMDPKNIIAQVSTRRDAFHGEHHVKSLDKLNRDLSKVIVLD